ncbi:hypothetical protein OG874_27140 [Nocardia sp. NBC_00565]|uniref:hypothetical protein n=1 Tax=Nocardia sp. NBC_00565 TaxID=2975993 RepID=UPI002E80D943|nr:hypothetical protein [Nocardia sp. NBC_00565]WUC00539.1 hypothetical protein OG874_27140 [Nocardia sp. NBC_00565]
MTEYEGQLGLSDFVRSMTTRIDRHGEAYAAEVTEFREEPHTGQDDSAERELLDSFNIHVENVVAHYNPPETRRRGDSLVFAHIYVAVGRSADEDEGVRRTLLTALLAAEVELRGPLRLSPTQNMHLAGIYERIGTDLTAHGLPAHAVLSLRRAASLHGQNEDVDAQDRCGLAMARARRQARSPAWRRIPGWAADLLCGYGYRPFRLLPWIALLLVTFTIGLRASAEVSITTAFHICLVNFLNPIGLGDLDRVHQIGRGLLIIESYVGIISTSVFFALLVRRWFRL